MIAFSSIDAVPSDFVTHSGVIPAKAGIHAAAFARAHGTAASTPKSTAEWIPAFAGMTTEGVSVDAASSVCAAAALSVHANAADPVTRHQNSRAR